MNRRPKYYAGIDEVVMALHKADPELPIETIYMLLQAMDLPPSEWSMTIHDGAELGAHLDTERGYGLGEEELTFFGLGGVVSLCWKGVVHTTRTEFGATVHRSEVYPRAKMRKANLRAELMAVCRKYGVTLNEGGNILTFASMELEAEYTDDQLKEAFDLVQPVDNWKNPIDCRVYLSEGERELVSKAITHYTGGLAEFLPLLINKGQVRVRRQRLIDDGPQSLYRVIAPGYYMSVGA